MTSNSRGYTYLGEATAAAYGLELYQRPLPTKTDVNCDDFPTSGSAQKYFLTHGGPHSDPYGLDRDGDGLACEWGAYLQKSVRRAKSLQESSRRESSRRAVRSSSRCYTGPRGGTYTITASGNKNYGGC
ncbi:excalibur calcium-binding domain-containing protein [Mangrovicoccus ximenensis]|uniref:excalibur calcium-binding domain-containing protein n=1 Tax=Mangrovicoccus ximenensis TaxID=1911570 RepID=UPI0038B3620B